MPLRKKESVELSPAPRPSRIRRDPPVRTTQKSLRAYPTEYEVWSVVIGVVLFALAITIIIVELSDFTSH
jgi:hypothetical protein